MPGGGQQAGRPEAARPGGYLCSIFTGMCFSPVDCFFRGACSCRGPCPAFTNPSTASSEAPAPAGLVKYLVHEGNRRSSRFAQTAVEAVSASDCSSLCRWEYTSAASSPKRVTSADATTVAASDAADECNSQPHKTPAPAVVFTLLAEITY